MHNRPTVDPPIHTSLVLAMSLDGKIADHRRQAARFSSQADLQHLETRVAAADGVLFGGGTLRAYGTTLSVRNPQLLSQRQAQGLPPQPWQIVWSPSGKLDPECRFFRQSVPRGLLTTPLGAKPWKQGGFHHIWTMPDPLVAPWDWGYAWQQFAQVGIRRLALLGGGRLSAALLHWGLVDEIYLTLCPVVLGGATAPTPVDGEGFLAEVAPRLQLLSTQTLGDEVFLHYRVCG
jgi:5-amino-6-(5-phosphoribosylamino)uracil reductase